MPELDPKLPRRFLVFGSSSQQASSLQTTSSIGYESLTVDAILADLLSKGSIFKAVWLANRTQDYHQFGSLPYICLVKAFRQV